ncbi:hypothetical protein ACWXWU_04460 [Shewanella sp. A14]
MKTHAKTTQDNKRQSISNGLSAKHRGTGFTLQFVDHRPEVIAQRKLQNIANDFSSNRHDPIQKQAKVARRPLAQAEYDTSETNSLVNGRGLLHHAHIIFDRGYVLPTVGASDNVGYHAIEGASGPGELFKEQVHTRGYSDIKTLSNDDYEDRVLIQSIGRKNNFGEYKLGRHDCQSWVKAVESDYLKTKDAGVEMQTFTDIKNDKDANAKVKLDNLHALNPDGIELEDI